MANEREQMKEPCCCPYCDTEMAQAALPYCQACEVEVLYCPTCREAIPQDKQVCPHCGYDVRSGADKRGR